MKIIVLGGTGFIGRELCDKLVGKNYEVFAVGRNDNCTNIIQGVRYIQGDIKDYQFLKKNFEGMDIVVNLVALSPLYKPKGGGIEHENTQIEGTKNAVRAAKECRVKKIIQLSAIGADPNAVTYYLSSKGKAEEIIKKSNIEWVIFRPSVVFGEGGEFVSFIKKIAPPYITPLPGGGKMLFDPIWIEDFVPLIIQSIRKNTYNMKIFEIGGPEIMSMAHITRLIHASEGRWCKIIPLPMWIQRIFMEIAEKITVIPFGIDQYRSLKLEVTAKKNAIEEFGVVKEDLVTFENYLFGRR